MKTALVIGATGLTGSFLLNFLLEDARFSKIKVFTRRKTGISDNKLEEYLIDFDNPETVCDILKGDVLFSTLGTTIRKAGSKEAQYMIDCTYQYKIAEICARNNTGTYVLLSSAGANPSSKIFYSKMKGELDRDVQKLPFQTIRILKPGILEGERSEHRTGEKVMINLSKIISKLPGLKKLRPIHVRTVARAMINSCFDETKGIKIYTMEEIFLLSNNELLMNIKN